MKPETGLVVVALGAMLISTGTSLVGPVIIGRGVDTYVRLKDSHGLLIASLVLMAVYLVGVVASYTQIRTMGGVGRRVLFSLRNALFTKLQDLPVAFFNQNKAGDLISRVNNDTDKLNQFVAQALMQFLSSLFLMTGAAVFALSLNFRLGIAALLPAVGVLIVTQGHVGLGEGQKHEKPAKHRWDELGDSGEPAELQGDRRLSPHGLLPAEVRDRERGQLCRRPSRPATRITCSCRCTAWLTTWRSFSSWPTGLYSSEGMQTTAGAVDRIPSLRQQLLRSHAAAGHGVVVVPACAGRAGPDLGSAGARIRHDAGEPAGPAESTSVLEFRNVSFQYPGGKNVLRDVSFELEKGKAYALVGPTGGGKTTTASLMARLYDPTEGSVFLDGRDIRSVAPDDRSRKVGFIPQEPFLFSGTVRDNIVYGNDEYRDYSSPQLAEVLEQANLSSLLARFSEGLDTKVATSGNSISLGQKQLIAFMRATLRRPELLILDEATANIDTVTEQLLEEILDKLAARDHEGDHRASSEHHR